MELKVLFLELLVSSAAHVVRAVHTQSLKFRPHSSNTHSSDSQISKPQILTASKTHSSDSEISSQHRRRETPLLVCQVVPQLHRCRACLVCDLEVFVAVSVSCTDESARPACFPHTKMSRDRDASPPRCHVTVVSGQSIEWSDTSSWPLRDEQTGCAALCARRS